MRRTKHVGGALAKRNWRRRLLEVAFEVVFAVVLVVGIILYAVYGPEEAPFEFKWIPFALNTAYVFGVALKTAWPLRKKPKLWAVLATSLLTHLTIGWVLLRGLESIPLIWYVPVVVVELTAVLQIVEWSFTAAELEECAPVESTFKPY